MSDESKKSVNEIVSYVAEEMRKSFERPIGECPSEEYLDGLAANMQSHLRIYDPNASCVREDRLHFTIRYTPQYLNVDIVIDTGASK